MKQKLLVVISEQKGSQIGKPALYYSFQWQIWKSSKHIVDGDFCSIAANATNCKKLYNFSSDKVKLELKI